MINWVEYIWAVKGEFQGNTLQKYWCRIGKTRSTGGRIWTIIISCLKFDDNRL